MSAGRRRPPAYWYGTEAPPWTARAISALYGGVLALRERLGFPHAQRVAKPVVVVGNLIAGGSG
ncbi:MAG TPA: tetraacyldisaccharide 4'-kinase, partial [Lysobacter sp.]|nr:tetraacyldisaccharide 4'-kinase [Lysobacter sp.]